MLPHVDDLNNLAQVNVLTPSLLARLLLIERQSTVVERVVFAWRHVLDFELILDDLFDCVSLFRNPNDLVDHLSRNYDYAVVITYNTVARPNQNAAALYRVVNLPRPKIGRTLFGGRAVTVDGKAILLQ